MDTIERIRGRHFPLELFYKIYILIHSVENECNLPGFFKGFVQYAKLNHQRTMLFDALKRKFPGLTTYGDDDSDVIEGTSDLKGTSDVIEGTSDLIGGTSDVTEDMVKDVIEGTSDLIEGTSDVTEDMVEDVIEGTSDLIEGTSDVTEDM